MPFYVNKAHPELGDYDIEVAESGYRWVWNETAKGVEYTDFGKWRTTRAEALVDAADDWEDNGSSGNRRLAGLLRGAATKAKRAES